MSSKTNCIEALEFFAMSRNKSLHAFTIAELSIAMLITGLLVTFGYFLLSTFSADSNQWINLQNASVTSSRAIATLRWDIANAQTLTTSGNSIECRNGNGRLVSYTLNDQLVRTENGNIDTFELKVLNFRLHSAKEELVDTIQLSVEIASQPASAIFVKHYSSHDLMTHGSED